MRYLPLEEEQDWLLREMAGLIAARGYEPFVCAPIVRPTPEYFPDPVRSLPEALDRVTRRLLEYAGLGELDARIDWFDSADEEGLAKEDAEHRARVAGCFFGIVDGCCHFGVNRDLPQMIERLAGVMAHEVAHAYRAHHALCVDDPDKEELLTDLTETYLGFGVLAVNASHQYRKWNFLSGNELYIGQYQSQAGYLPPQAHSFLLASQLVARDLDARSCRAIYRQLEVNQAAFVKAAVTLFKEQPINAAHVLKLPPHEDWPPARALEEILGTLKPYVPMDDEAHEQVLEGTPWNAGRPVFRLRESRLFPMIGFGTVIATIPGIASTLLFESWLAAVLVFLLGAAIGAWTGLRTRREKCSDAECDATLEAGLSRCPKCGGEIMGSISYPDERLAMEEKFAKEAARRGKRARQPQAG